MESKFGFLISQIKQVSGRIFNKILAEKNIDAFNGEQGKILYVLWQKDGISLKNLSDECGLAPTSLTSMIDRMEQKELITRKLDKQDRSKTLIYLTEKAKSLKTEYDKVSSQMFEIHFKDFSKEQITALEENLQQVLSNIEKYKENK